MKKFCVLLNAMIAMAPRLKSNSESLHNFHSESFIEVHKFKSETSFRAHKNIPHTDTELASENRVIKPWTREAFYVQQQGL